MARLEIEVLPCFETRIARSLPLTADELLTVAVTFIRTIQDCRMGAPVDHDGRFILGAMACEIAGILNRPRRPVRKARSHLAPNVIGVDFRGAVS